MKMIMAIVAKEDTGAVTQALTKAEYYITRLSTTGGFLRSGNTTLLIGTDDEKVEACIRIIGENAKNHVGKVPDKPGEKVQAGGATIFVMNISHFTKL